MKSICHGCSSSIKYTEKHAGRRVRCPKCQQPIQLPAIAMPVQSGVLLAADAHSCPPGAIPSPPNSEKKSCQYCGETVRAVAKKCRFCGEFFEKEGQSGESFRPSSKFLIVSSVVAAGALLLCLFGLFLFLKGRVAADSSGQSQSSVKQLGSTSNGFVVPSAAEIGFEAINQFAEGHEFKSERISILVHASWNDVHLYDKDANENWIRNRVLELFVSVNNLHDRKTLRLADENAYRPHHFHVFDDVGNVVAGKDYAPYSLQSEIQDQIKPQEDLTGLLFHFEDPLPKTEYLVVHVNLAAFGLDGHAAFRLEMSDLQDRFAKNEGRGNRESLREAIEQGLKDGLLPEGFDVESVMSNFPR